MTTPPVPNAIIIRGGPLDGRLFGLFDPLTPPSALRHDDAEGQHFYTPRPLVDKDDGPLWEYVYLRTQPASTE